MKKFNWQEFIRTHPLFSSLSKIEIGELEELSEEKEFPQGSLIVREGAVEDTIFLIGSGSVQVVLPEKGGNETSLSILPKGEIFGEMAVLDKRPRSATVKANENCTLLEIKGQEFLKILGDHPDLEFKILLKLSERLRVLNDHLLTIKVQDIDEKLKLFNSKLDAELKAVEAQLKAAQAVFDQTKMRADEIITSADRTRARVNVTFTTVTGLIAMGGALLGWLGFSNLKEINSLSQEASQHMESIRKNSVDVSQVWRLHQSVGALTNQLADAVVMLMFDEALAKNRQIAAKELYEAVQKIKAEPGLIKNVLGKIEGSIIENPSRDFKLLLGTILTDAIQNQPIKKGFVDQPSLSDPEDIIRCRYLLLTNEILVPVESRTKKLPHGETIDETLDRLEKYIVRHTDERLPKKDLQSMEKLFAQQDKPKQQAFDRVKKLVMSPEVPLIPTL
jgi:CRP-like cAMP-binding protein